MITKGEIYLCIKTVYMDGNPKDIAYNKGKTYVSDVDNSLKDNYGSSHFWDVSKEFNEYFKKYAIPMKEDRVNHPSHYTWLKDKCGIEVIDITRHMDFCLGNAIKYILRAGHKQDASLTDNQKEIEDLKKAIWYIKDRIKQLGGEV